MNLPKKLSFSSAFMSIKLNLSKVVFPVLYFKYIDCWTIRLSCLIFFSSCADHKDVPERNWSFCASYISPRRIPDRKTFQVNRNKTKHKMTIYNISLQFVPISQAIFLIISNRDLLVVHDLKRC